MRVTKHTLKYLALALGATGLEKEIGT